jgi:hypothetical protein
MQEKLINDLVGGMDLDQSDVRVASTDWRTALNIVSGVAYTGQQNVITSVKGNTLEPYTLPTNSTKVVGAYADIQENTVIYFLHDLTGSGKDQILRYDKDASNKISLIVEYDFGWNADTEIKGVTLQSNRLLYWNDPKPRKINIEKAPIANKKKEWEIVIAKSVTGDDLVDFNVYSMNGTLLTTKLFFLDNEGVGAKLEQLADFINAELSQYFEAEYCDCKITLTEKQVNLVYPTIDNFPYYFIVPTNWYGNVLTDRIFDRAKWQPPLEPLVEFAKDPSILYNRVSEKVFQFRLQYWYDDNEGSDLALGSISTIPINNMLCGSGVNEAYNCIKLTIPDTSLVTPSSMSIIKQVRILVREGNEGIWRIVENLDYCQWVDLVDGNITATYTFYNDIATTAIDDATVNKPYDDVPLECGDGLVIKNRAVLSNVTKGYDTPDCLEVTVEQDFEEVANFGYDITLNISIYSPYLDLNTPSNWSKFGEAPKSLLKRGLVAIDTTRENPEIYYGGQQLNVGQGSFHVRAGMEDVYDQRLGEGGFVAYLAGTERFAISQQPTTINGVPHNLPTAQSGAIVTTLSTQTQIGQFLLAGTGGNTPFGYNEISSSVTFKNVPNGTYLIRLASNWCSYGDKLDKGQIYDLYNGTAYQKTSMPLLGVIPFDTTSNSFKPFQPYKELKVTVNNGNVYAGEIVVCDLADRYDGLSKSHGVGYLYDNEGEIGIDEIKLGVPVEQSVVEVSVGAWFSFNSLYYLKQSVPLTPEGKISDDGKSYLSLTDHNGFFWYCRIDGYGVDSNKGVVLISAGGTTSRFRYLTSPFYSGSINDLLFGNISGVSIPYSPYATQFASIGGYSSIFANNDPDKVEQWIAPTALATSRAENATFIKGRIVEQTTGEGVVGINVCMEWGQTVKTDVNGQFTLRTFGTTYKNGLLAPYQQRFGDLVFMSNFCGIEYVNGYTLYIDVQPIGANAGTIPPPYSITAIYDIGDYLANETKATLGKARKRGGSYLLGGRFYDEHGRFCSVVQAAEVYIPFITENLHTYFPDKYTNPNTYLHGRPTITATITTPPPSWAKYFRFMWTKNLYQGKYLQWCANEVKYITSYDNDLDTFIETTYQNGDATMIMINISNIATYARQNNNSQVGYSYEDGDRLRLIADRDINYFNGLFDTEVFGYKTGGWLLIQNRVSLSEIKSGTFFEVYNNRPVTEDKLFFECGQPIKIINGAYENNTVEFDSGDTYWRGRSIPVLDDTTNFSAIYPLVVEDRSISDFFASEDEDIGRVGVIDETFKQIHYPTMMQHSNIFIEGSAVNGLSSFETSNFKILNVNFGAITRLVYVGNTLISVHTNKVVANYIELRSLSDANQTDGLLAISDAYFGNDRPMQSEYGSDKYNSIASYQGFVYGLDTAKGVIWRYDNNGIDAISDKLVRSYIRQLCADGVSRAVGVFDPYFRMYFLTTTNSDGEKSTIGWDEDKNRWSSFYSFTPEMYSYIQRDLVSFKDGQLWLHNTNTLYNNFYGVQYRSEITPIVCKIGDKQTFHAISFYGIQGEPLKSEWEIEQITNRYGQQSRLKKAHFRLKENLWAASFLRDTTDTTVSNPIVNGRNLRGEELVLKFVNSSPLFASIQTIFTTIVKSFR